MPRLPYPTFVARALRRRSLVTASLLLAVPLSAVAGIAPALAASAPATRGASDRGDAVRVTSATETRYVAADGRDGDAGTIRAPWKTLQYAADHAPSGSAVLIASGAYRGMVVERGNLMFSAMPGARVVVSDPTERHTVRIRAANVTVRGLVVQGAPMQFGAGVRVEETGGPVLVTGNELRENRSFGIKVKNASQVTISQNRIHHNESGIEISGSGHHNWVVDNEIYQNDRMVTCSRGGNGIVLHKTQDVRVSNNRIWGNRAVHCANDGYDGGAFEIYGAERLTIDGNRMWDNNNVMETGTDGSRPCVNITFVRNIAWSATTVRGEAQGLILRCAQDSLIAHNTLDGLDLFAFDINAAATEYGGSIEGLRITNNIVVRGRAFSIDSALPASVVIDYNLVRPDARFPATHGKYVAYVKGKGNTDSLSEFRQWTGRQENGLARWPLFVGWRKRDYRLTTVSPAIDRGVEVVAGRYRGRPDLGAVEYAR
jgi:parallel beta-helix repeat protein